jgi:hypothetical protein
MFFKMMDIKLLLCLVFCTFVQNNWIYITLDYFVNL